MKKVAHVWVQIPTRKINSTFSYEIPSELDFITSGWRVWVPFGKRLVEGVVLAIVDDCSHDPTSEFSLKAIGDILEPFPFYSPADIQLAEWFSREYFCSIGDALRLYVPSGREGKEEVRYTSHFDEETILTLSLAEKMMARWLKDNESSTMEKIQKQFDFKVAPILSKWLKENRISQSRVYKKIAKPKMIAHYELSPLGREALEGDLVKGLKQRRALEVLKISGATRSELIEEEISLPTIRSLVEKQWIDEELKLEKREKFSESVTDSSLILSEEQADAVGEITQIQRAGLFHEFLLFGITGSGKTEVYLRAAEQAQELNKSLILLTPEIALTSQLVVRFQEKFGDKVVVFHSSISLGEKRTAWAQVQSGDASIIIGARSALFAPTKNLGLVILDEEHEFTYKQEEFPKYHAREVARKRAELEKAVLILGSATPSLESYYRAKMGLSTLLSLPNRIGSSQLPQVEVVDMREELKKGNRTILSLALQNLIEETLQKNEQIILLMNRRGYSTFVMCRECGYVAECKDCHVSLVYHQRRSKLECHYCHQKHEVPEICPSCGSSYIRFFGSGTEKVEEYIKERYPSARVARLDRDTTLRKGAGEQILANFRNGSTDILIGTQMVAKGHDIPNVTAIGVISADTVLHIPDFRSSEQTFSLLTQAAGRAGRGDLRGKVVIQTYSPNEPSILDAAEQEYIDFAEKELDTRKLLFYPPYSQLFKCTVFHSSEYMVRETMRNVLEEMATKSEYFEFLGPYPELLPYQRSANRWFQHVLVKTGRIEETVDFLSDLKERYSDFLNIDHNPIRIF